MGQDAGLDSFLQLRPRFQKLCLFADLANKPAQIHSSSKRYAIYHKGNAGHSLGWNFQHAFVRYGR
jgi:hypothetical protein